MLERDSKTLPVAKTLSNFVLPLLSTRYCRTTSNKEEEEDDEDNDDVLDDDDVLAAREFCRPVLHSVELNPHHDSDFKDSSDLSRVQSLIFIYIP